MASIETSRPPGHECSKRPGTHQRMHLRQIVDAKVIRLIHDNYRELGSGLGESKNARPLQVVSRIIYADNQGGQVRFGSNCELASCANRVRSSVNFRRSVLQRRERRNGPLSDITVLDQQSSREPRTLDKHLKIVIWRGQIGSL